VTGPAFEALRAPNPNPQFTPLYWQKYAEGFNKWDFRGPELVCWAREQSIEETEIIPS
jgi:hypothetical protein